MRKKQRKRHTRHRRVRAKISGTAQRPRLCVFRSANHIYTQLIDDDKGKTLLSASDQEIKKPRTRANKSLSGPKTEIKKDQKPLTKKVAVAHEVGKLIAEKALKKKIEKVVFDRGGFAYHGRVKALAEAARKGGLKF